MENYIDYVLQRSWQMTRSSGSLTVPHDASAGVPDWFWLTTGVVVVSFCVYMYLEIQKDKSN